MEKKHMCKCGNDLTFRGSYSAPGFGNRWECYNCNKTYTEVAGRYYDDNDVEVDTFIMDPSDEM